MTSAGARVGGAAFSRLPAWLLALAVAATYFATARLGLQLAMPGGHVSPVWPPSGIALATMLLLGRRAWPGILMGSLAENLVDLHGSGQGFATEFGVSLAISFGAVMTALLGARMVRHLTSGREPLGQVRDVCIVLAVGGAAGCILSATLGVATLGAGGFIESENFAQVWQTWWMGDTAGVFLGTPLLLAWSRRPSWPDRPAFWQEAACCFGVLIGAAWVVFVVFAGRPLAFIFMPLVVWPAVRFHTRGATAAVLAIAVPAVWGTIHGRGPFAANPRNEALLMLELFLSLVVLTALCVSAIVTGREEAQAAKQQAFDELESRVIERTAALVEVNEKLTAEIIERRSAEEALRASESSLALAQAHAHLGSWELDLAALTGAWSAEMYRLHGRDPALGPMTFTEFMKVVHPDDQSALRKFQVATVANRRNGLRQFRIVRPDSSIRWIEGRFQPIYDAEGRPARLIGTSQDITERKEAEEKVAQLLAETEHSRWALLNLLEDARRAEDELRRSQEQLRSLAAHLDTIREDEDRRIARELHDELGATLTGLKIDVAWLNRHLPPTGTPETVAPLQARIGRILETIDATMQSVRNICLELRPELLDQLGFAAAIEAHAREFETRSGIPCALVTTGSVSLRPERATMVFRVFQEILTNILRHAKASFVRVELTAENGDVVLAVSDDGIGIAADTLARTKRLGIVGMRERALATGGSLTIEEAPGGGTTVKVQIPAGG